MHYNNKLVDSPDALEALLNSAITNNEDAEVALKHIIKTYSLNTSIMQRILSSVFIFFLKIS